MGRYGRMDIGVFMKEVELWKSALSGTGKRIFSVLPVGLRSGSAENASEGERLEMLKKIFFSAAPLGMACHELGKDIFFYGSNIDDDALLQSLLSVWNSPEKRGERYARDFLKGAASFMKRRDADFFMSVFERPEIVLLGSGKVAGGMNHSGYDAAGKIYVESSWWRRRVKKIGGKLALISDVVWKNAFAPKRDDFLQVRFELVPAWAEGVVLEDYLDNFLIAWFMTASALKNSMNRKSGVKGVSFRAHSMRKSSSDYPEATAELISTLAGCELSVWKRSEGVFSKYRKMKSALGIGFEIASAVFGISGSGFYGRHVFGESIGYPVKCGGGRKRESRSCGERWTSPGQMIFKFPWLVQSRIEERPPLSRIGFTQTVPVEEFVQSNDIDWDAMRRTNRRVESLMKKCSIIEVKSSSVSGSNFRVCIRRPDGTFRGVKRSDADARHVVDPSFLKREKKLFGMMANIPGGECFVTPEWVEGRIVGDVVVSVDSSHLLSGRRPLVISAERNLYRIVGGPESVVSAIKTHRDNAWKSLLRQRKVLSREEFRIKKDNFTRIGEFAINTNDRAPVSRHLIISEKAAGMIHVALGSGFDSDRATTYHYDVVIDAKRQKLDIVGITSGGGRVWFMRKGKLSV